MEVWAYLTDGYAISDFGRFWSTRVGVMKTPINNKGYPHLNIRQNGASVRIMCHVSVAMTFIPNPENKRCVNHIDGNKANNIVANLEWATYSENHIHAIKYLGKQGAKNNHRRKKILATKDGCDPVEVLGVRELARLIGVPYQAVQNGLKNSRLKYLGWGFKLIEDSSWTPKLLKVLPAVATEERGYKLYGKLIELIK